MARGFLAGVIWGTVVTTAGAGALSLMVDRSVPSGPDVVTEAPDVADPESVRPVQITINEDNAPEAVDPESMREMSRDETPKPAAQTPVPEVSDTAEALAQVQPIGDDVAMVVTEDDAPTVQDNLEVVPNMPSADVEPNAAEESAPVETSKEAPETVQVVELDTPPVAPDAEADNAPSVEAPAPAPEPAPEDAPRAAVNEVSDRPRIGKPAASLTERDPAVPQGRLPAVTSSSEKDEAPDSGEPATLGALSDDSPLVKFSVPFKPEDGVPRMAIVLIDDGSGPMGPAELETFPFPVTFAIDPAHPNPAEAARGYRERGFEVLALADMPDGAQPSDVEVTLAGLLDTVPEAVGVLEGPSGGLQSSRAIASQAAAFLGASGHGLVMEQNGLNTAQKLAAKEGVPSASLFRDLDGEGQDQALIRRTLDQASFRARQEGEAVMLGRIRADTVSALLLWGLQDRGNTITLVPISTILQESVKNVSSN
ncbi:divergent polysaccharide deacetylase family protein [Sagittula sp. NFXS13]|uniref:divergent polysaccharide deacetylase family protein n=1 Tax=Sagittula sp. NFXS13 TaxID=2819095 RepID=UPI0032DFDFA6